MNSMKAAAAGLAVLASGSAVAADTTFSNHLMSAPMVSPAQIYQVEDATTDFALGYTSDETSSKPKGGETATSTTTGTDLFAAGVYNIQSIGLRAGLTVNYRSLSDESDVLSAGTMTTAESEGTEMVLTPQVAYPVGPMVFGAAFDLVQRSVDGDIGEEAKSSHTTFRPGALYRNNDLEAGLTYSSPNRRLAEDTDELTVVEAAEVTAHGRYAITRDFAAGAIITNTNYAAVNDDNLEDRQTVKGTAEYGMGAVKVDGELGYNTAFHKNDDAMNELTIGTYEIGAGADYSISKAAAVGGALNYEFGSDENDVADYKADVFAFAVRGNMTF